ncbi:MAG: HD domain-containing phosphohydrolase [Thermoleophilia bacterium]|jgi:sensor domain CHASE-containing protein/GAF domain-containing protein
MTLRKKTFLIIGLTVVSLLAVFYLLSTTILLNGFKDVEIRDTRKEIQRPIDSLDSDLAFLGNTTRDWAVWDDTYAFIVDRNPDYIKTIESSFVNNQLNMMMFVDASANTVFVEAYDLTEKKTVPVPAGWLSLLGKESGLLSRPDSTDGVRGLIMLPEGPMLVAAYPILASDGNGPARGTVIWGRYLDQAQVERLGELTNLSLSAYNLDDPAMPADFRQAQITLNGEDRYYVETLDSDSIAGYARLDDIGGAPAMILRVDTPRAIFQQGLSTMHYFVGFIFAASIIFGVTTITLLEVTIFSRMSSISDDVRNIGSRKDATSRVRIKGGDELSSLAGGINTMLSSMEESHTELRLAHDNLEARVQERTVELRDKVAVLQTLTEIDSEVMGATRSQSILNLVCHRAAELLRAPKGLIALIDTEDRAHVAATVGLEYEEGIEEEIAPYLNADGLDNIDLYHNGAFAVNRIAATMPHMSEFRSRENIQSLAVAPLTTDGRMLGGLLVFDTVQRQWSPDEVQVMGLLSVQAAIALDEARLFEEEQSRREELAVLYGLSRELADAPPEIDKILELVAKHTVETTHVTFAGIALVDDSGELMVRAAHPVRSLQFDLLTDSSKAAQQNFCHLILELFAPVVIHDDSPDLSPREREMLFPDKTHTLCLVPLRAGDRALGLLMLGETRGEEREPFTPEKTRLAHSIADQTASALGRAELFIELEHSYLETVLSLASAVEAKDAYTAGHAASLAAMALMVGEETGMSHMELDDLRYGAVLHDIGKIGVPDSVLQKPGKLDEDEWLQMKRHPEIGAKILRPVPRLAGAASIVHHHHERYDGGGYPDGLAGEHIPVGASILTIVDSFSAMIDERIYKHAYSHEKAVTELRRCAGTQFDPGLVEVFLELINRGAIS